MPNNLKTKKCRGCKYKLNLNGFKVNYKLHLYQLKKNWDKMLKD